MPRRRMAHVERAEQVHLEHGLEIVDAHAVEDAVAQEARIVHDTVEAAEGVQRGLDDAVGRGHLGDAVAIGHRLAAALTDDPDGVLVMLADMPGVSAADLVKLISAFRAQAGRPIVRAVADGKRGNPVILPRATFEALRSLEGDIGARPIIESAGLPVTDVEIGLAARLDVDTPEAVIAAGGVLKG